ncbi:hypothetical protein ASF69_10410 [Rhizobium sp. Leaf311]|nr:hypothetical protein ASF69_10410 [Rhizobium sp. Leaf311]
MRLHRAFIDASAERLRQNLSVFMETFRTRTLGSPERDALIPDLWSSVRMFEQSGGGGFVEVNVGGEGDDKGGDEWGPPLQNSSQGT